MIKDGGLSFETQLKIELLPSNSGSKNAWKNPWVIDSLVFAKTSIFSPKIKMIRGGLAAILLVSNFLTAIWQPHGWLWATIKGATSLTQC